MPGRYAKAGFTTFDTADIYGRSEAVLGQLRSKGVEPIIHTKYVTRASDAETARAVNHRSVQALGGVPDLVAFHWSVHSVSFVHNRFLSPLVSTLEHPHAATIPSLHMHVQFACSPLASSVGIWLTCECLDGRWDYADNRFVQVVVSQLGFLCGSDSVMLFSLSVVLSCSHRLCIAHKIKQAAKHLAQLKNEGGLRHVGACNFDLPHLQQMVEAGVPVGWL